MIGGIVMDKEVPQCHRCGVSITEDDIEAKRAIRLLNQYYCPGCCNRITTRQRSLASRIPLPWIVLILIASLGALILGYMLLFG